MDTVEDAVVVIFDKPMKLEQKAEAVDPSNPRLTVVADLVGGHTEELDEGAGAVHVRS
jgi:hypothetical protein